MKIKNDVNSSRKALNSSSTSPGFLYILEIIYFLHCAFDEISQHINIPNQWPSS